MDVQLYVALPAEWPTAAAAERFGFREVDPMKVTRFPAFDAKKFELEMEDLYREAAR